MRTIQQFRPVLFVFVAVLAFVLYTPFAVNAEDETIVPLQEEQILAAVPGVPSWDETSGYGAVEASRAAVSGLLAPSASPSWDATSGYGAVEASRAAIGHDDAGSGNTATGHEASAAIGLSWDETSGYGAVEASRAANAMPVAAPVVLADC